MIQEKTKVLNYYLLIVIFLFLPFSSWLVSLTGRPELSLIRDILVIALLLLALVKNGDRTQHNRLVLGLSVAFVVWGVLSVFWREASFVQWLRGARFDLMPIVFFAAASTFICDRNEDQGLFRVVIGAGAVIGVLGILELCGIRLPLYTDYSAVGAIKDINYVGEWNQVRLKSVLAGPNALGLYMLTLVAFVYSYLSGRKRLLLFVFFSVILFLTFSRSALIGLLVLLFVAGFWNLKPKFGLVKTVSAVAMVVLVMGMTGFLLMSSPVLKNFITHGDSSSLRWQQYERVWEQRGEIGLLGRGAGGAGPSSQNRLDGGPNRWTENVYLDMFEAYGLVGAMLYLSLIISLMLAIVRTKSLDARGSILILISFGVSGIFLNYYVGQIGIYLFWLMHSMVLRRANPRLGNIG
ncbi:MAG: O-Antigen ligase [bacterium ADurb.Bin400]|nr:MAG: O-Antigen ligase [bacterium ADurb.Bin400]